ncbi:MAG: CDP-alcohol phosphatidyltransferase family protein [Candidatus Aminicenantes bacterium]|nr:CDP-alcohol phosphatidyltransferase family protein [Candidatus Aminicenantes bacterium]
MMINYENKGFRFLPAWLIVFTLKVFDRLSLIFVQFNINPNYLSFLGLLSGILVGLFYGLNRPGWALLFLFFCGMLDILDGKVASNGNRRTIFGAMFDSSLDRYSEFAIYLGLAYHFRNHWILWGLAFAFLGSTMVSYTRARAESLGIDCRIGIMQRAERLVLLILGTVAGMIFRQYDLALIIAILFLAAMSNFTAFQRIFYVYKFEGKKKSSS